jgi:DedD protein
VAAAAALPAIASALAVASAPVTTPLASRAQGVVAVASAPATPGPARADDGTRARALLEGSTAAPPAATASAAGRFVVQVGAYSDANKLRDARVKVEKLGLKTYTQVVESDAGKRTRVRVGPYATREEAEAVATKVKRNGLPANILAL